jgi:hypothetical protein
MKNDKAEAEFRELELEAMIVPYQRGWPNDTLHWQRLHEAANEARARVRKAYMQMDEIDRSADLSRDAKYRQRSQTAAEAIADFEASKTLARACQAVELVVAKHNIEPEVRDATLKAMNQAEQGWQRAMDKIAERASLTKNPNKRC